MNINSLKSALCARADECNKRFGMHDSRGIRFRHLLVQTVGQLAVLIGLACARTAIAQDLNLTPVGTWPGPIVDLGSGVAVVGRHAFVTGGGHRPGLCVFDVGEAAPPRLVASLTTDRLPWMVPEIAVSGNHAFITEGDGRMLVVDVSDPTRPQMLTAFDTSGPVDHLAVAGSYAFLAGASFSRDTPDAPPGMVQIIDISDPAHPRQVSSYAMAPISANYFGMSAVASDGHFLCIAYHHDTGSTAMLEVVDVREPATPRRVGVYEAPGGVNGGGVNALAVGNGRAYFAPYTVSATFTRLSRLEVIDLADPAGPKRLGSLSTTGEVRSLALAGQYLYAAKDTYPGGPVDIINIADPAKPLRVGGFGDSTQDSPYIAVAEGKACIRTGTGLISFDVSEPTVMRRLGTLNRQQGSADVAVSGSHAIVADGFNGLQVLDTSQPANPRRIGGLKTTEYAHRVLVLGNHAYLAAIDLQTFDLSQPASPRRTSMIPADATDLDGSGKVLCAVGYGSDLQVFDISNPALPRRVGLHQVRYPDGNKWVAASSNYVFVISAQSWPTASAVEVFDLSIPSSPQLVSSYEPPGRPRGIAVSGNLAVLVGTAYSDPQDSSTGYGFVEVLDVADPGNPTLIASQSLDEGAENVTILDNSAFVSCSGHDPLGKMDRFKNLVVLDLTEPTRPRRIGGYKSAGRRVAVSGDYLFATASYAGLSVLQMRAPAVSLSNTLEVGGHAFGLAVEEPLAYVAAGEAGLQVLNLNDPSRPVVSGNLPTDGTAWDVALANGRAYVAAGEAGLMIADIGSSANPQWLGVLDTPGDARAVLASGTTVYVADGAEGVQVVDVSDPIQPRRLGGHGTTGWATGLAKQGDHLLVACREAGLMVLDVSDPVNPRSVATYNRGGYVVAVTVVGSRALLSDGLEGITILDITNPADLKRIGAAPGNGGYGRGIAVSGRFAYVAGDRAGVQVYDLADPARPRHLGGNSALEGYRLVISGGRLLAAGGQGGLGVFNLYTPPLNVEASSTQTSGSLSLRVDGPAGASARIQRSADLSTWQDWQTLTLGEVPQTLSDAVTTSQMQMFYRAVSP